MKYICMEAPSEHTDGSYLQFLYILLALFYERILRIKSDLLKVYSNIKN